MGLGRLDIVAKELDITIDRRPFLLRPDCPPEGQPRRLFDGETETELNPAMNERARFSGLVLRRLNWSPNTLFVKEARLYAMEQGLDDRFHHVAASAYWEESADLGSLEVIRGLAEKAGLDWSELRPRLESGHYRDAVLESNETARASGIGGTPTYLIGGWRKFGDLSVEELKTIIEAVGR
ncbi:MAG: thioredoxin domain-containing protein [Chloroflexi bacterium]|nr:thioredoxin domain-containing protein [Chloroflexota bacterium]